MPPDGFNCKQCGNCCINIPGAYAHSIDEEDVERWKKNRRNDILKWVISIDYEKFTIHDVWFHPETGDDVSSCPWLEKSDNGKYKCAIHDLRPNYCREWPPTKKDAINTQCRGFSDES